MLDAIIIISFVLAGAGIGFYSIELLPPNVLLEVTNIEGLRSVLAAFTSLIGFVLGLVFQTTYRRVEAKVAQMPVDLLLTRAIGLVIGLLVANLMLAPLFLLPIPEEFSFIKPLVAVLGSVMLGFTGVNVADTHGRGFLRLINPNSLDAVLIAEGTLQPATTKILDTSCIIDGRIENLLETGFLEGQILVPQFVLQELQLIADASNDQKRVRGRRGLDILNRIKEVYPSQIQIHFADYEDISTVDAKLVHFALEINGTLLTNDYNLSKVASLQKVMVLNINDLTQAVRPSYLPGDTIEIKIRKAGKEPSQGIGYLDDGTMVVVESGSEYVGDEVRVIVTSSLQTSAGRMIFARTQESALA
ncbi:MAG: PIN/TRAM domain-containing protein [Okeania sp. SIO3H1]|uniref:PIN/TRAM domain-containing protein n=1 Tax=Okeania sp. SIO1I7 TaxID=2607772 RepID=UPI0013C97906|nr:PIN/TRAM domain-containing protein [Okeania sp. SIO1I7]NEN90675.1 PIN/TRAM domain-containing protein [Okeania sp. SIO3H1]NET25580.1 PIN/TRAM domain-containing protein [Okeania sp. SIO1I7]